MSISAVNAPQSATYRRSVDANQAADVAQQDQPEAALDSQGLAANPPTSILSNSLRTAWWEDESDGISYLASSNVQGISGDPSVQIIPAVTDIIESDLLERRTKDAKIAFMVDSKEYAGTKKMVSFSAIAEAILQQAQTDYTKSEEQIRVRTAAVNDLIQDISAMTLMSMTSVMFSAQQTKSGEIRTDTNPTVAMLAAGSLFAFTNSALSSSNATTGNANSADAELRTQLSSMMHSIALASGCTEEQANAIVSSAMTALSSLIACSHSGSEMIAAAVDDFSSNLSANLIASGVEEGKAEVGAMIAGMLLSFAANTMAIISAPDSQLSNSEKIALLSKLLDKMSILARAGEAIGGGIDNYLSINGITPQPPATSFSSNIEKKQAIMLFLQSELTRIDEQPASSNNLTALQAKYQEQVVIFNGIMVNYANIQIVPEQYV